MSYHIHLCNNTNARKPFISAPPISPGPAKNDTIIETHIIEKNPIKNFFILSNIMTSPLINILLHIRSNSTDYKIKESLQRQLPMSASLSSSSFSNISIELTR